MLHRGMAATTLLIVCLLVNTDAHTANGSTVTNIFLPLVLVRSETTSGVITLHGTPVSGQPVTLTLTKPSGLVELITYSGPDGRYNFEPSSEMVLATSYQVGWKQTGEAAQTLLWWKCDEVAGQPGDQPWCGFDIAGVQAISPLSCELLNLPVTFTWQPRGVPGEGYSLVFLDDSKAVRIPLEMNPTAAGSYTLSTLPAELLRHRCYQWGVAVHGSNGSGEAVEDGWVMFR